MYEPGHNIFYKITSAPSEDINHPAYPRSLITEHSMGSHGSKASLRLISQSI